MRQKVIAAGVVAVLGVAALGATAQTAPHADLTRATSGYTYFHKVGATIDAHDADLAECVFASSQVHQPDQSGAIMFLGGGAIAGAMRGVAAVELAKHEANAVPANVENCMVARGWDVVMLSPQEGDTLRQSGLNATRTALAEWVGATSIHGAVARSFNNDAANAATAMFIFSGPSTPASLSADAARGRPPAASQPLPRRPRSANDLEPLDNDLIAKAWTDRALVAVRIRGSQRQKTETIGFVRIGADPNTPAWVADKLPDSFSVTLPENDNEGRSQISELSRTFAVPPGRWRIAWIGRDGLDVSFCQGGPSFEAKAGEVIYAGLFDFTGNLGPDLSLAKEKSLFTGKVARVGERMKPAVYQNGARGACGGSYVYALTVPVAP